MPRRQRRRREEGTRPARAGSAERHAGRDLLAADQWRGAQRHAGVVALARTTALATGALFEVARDCGGFAANQGSSAKTVIRRSASGQWVSAIRCDRRQRATLR